MTSFESLGLAPALLRALADQGLPEPTPVQAAAIPPLLAGRDVLMQARTGAGKSVALALPLLQQWLAGAAQHPRPTHALLLVPTRELALQLGETLRELAHSLPGLVKIAVVFGGVSINPQMMGLRGGADIVVATPGRLLDLVRHNALSLGQVKTLVLDEADRLLALGFEEELAEVLALLPARRQTVLSSATFPPAVTTLAEQWLHEPEQIRLSNLATARPDIRQRALVVEETRRTSLLRHLLAQRIELKQDARALVFVASQHAAEKVAHKLALAGVAAEPFHAGLSQGARQNMLHAFKQSKLQVLVATDMAARGLHIDALPLVVNYDLPRSSEDHVHRIGRTGRAGAEGEAISFVTPATEAHFRLIENRQGQRVPREQIAGFEPHVHHSAPAASVEEDTGDTPLPAGTGLDPNGGIKGKRKSKKDKLREEAAAAAAQAQRRPR
ncbi:MAG TPA: DEAD/DEAH box helicase [Ideonella sp.]|uniref:DEAD/DEAH box helicase n=1 Tax=Ideonella sp. TaxID=1929293 RepID=UPI002C487944|nr:DEAD/DEAH box helicase [Ideonella sp.]HSI51552.1 DEAD/DEAH box helicase [Ideonella sp.]